MDTITLYGFAPSTYTRTARLAAVERQIPNKLVALEFGQPSHFALHPFGKMPVLESGDTRVFETLAILEWLDNRGDGPALFGPDESTRTRVLTASSVAIDYAYRPVVHTPVVDGTPDPDALRQVHRVFDWLEKQLEDNVYLAGSTITAADLFFAPMLIYHRQQLDAEAALSARPRLAHWLSTMTDRESFAATEA